jgi:HAD superfamily hydrolase (TIGR01509 family)
VTVEALVFDLFGVVAAFDNDIVYARLARHCADPDDAFRRLNGLMASRDVITGRLTLPDVHRRLVDAHGYTLGYPEFETAWLAPYSWPMPGMAGLLGALAGRRLVLLSNVDRYYFGVVRAMQPELARFDEVRLSCDLGLAKPDPEIFREASRAAGTDPSRCFLVDDSPANVDAARALGFRTHLFRDVAGLRTELAEAGVRPLASGSEI